MTFSPARRRFLRLLWAAFCLLVGVGSLLPAWTPPMQAVSYLEISDKLLHFAGYLLLGFLPALHESPRGIAMFAAAAACIGILIEFAQQSAGGGRSLEVADMVADLAGIASGVLLGFRLRSTGATRRAGGASH